MASWIDMFSFFVISLLCAGTCFVIVSISKWMSAAAHNAKESLEHKGISISDHGMTVKTSRRFDREDYVDATQRGVMKVVGASTFHSGGASEDSHASHDNKSTSTVHLPLVEDSGEHGERWNSVIRRSGSNK